jgi:hypothetical protein
MFFSAEFGKRKGGRADISEAIPPLYRARKAEPISVDTRLSPDRDSNRLKYPDVECRRYENIIEGVTLPLVSVNPA